jgi:hypothetical protein
VWLAAALLFGNGCHTAPVLNTTSGRPEVIIQGKAAPQIREVASTFFLQRGYVPRPTDHTDKLSFEKRTERPGAAPSLTTCWRVRLTVTQLENGIHRLSGVPYKVDDCGADLESEHVLPMAYPQIQGFLEEIKNRVESGRQGNAR